MNTATTNNESASVHKRLTLPIVAAVSLSIGFITSEVRQKAEKNVAAPVQTEPFSNSTTHLPLPSMDPITSQDSELVNRYDIDGGVCYLYPDAEHAELSSAFVLQNGRYPVENFKMNKECTEAFFIIDGEYTLTLGRETRTLKAHDVVYVPLNTPYAMEGKGKSFVYITPKWKSEQNVHCDQDGNELPAPKKTED